MSDKIIFTCPGWNDVPSIDLYLDQVLYIIESSMSQMLPGQSKIITSTMVNNYVKQKIISPTEKKKYSRKQISEIIMVTLLKLVLSSGEIIAVLGELSGAFPDPEAVYNAFLRGLSFELGIEGTEEKPTLPEMSLAALKALAGKIQFCQIRAAMA